MDFCVSGARSLGYGVVVAGESCSIGSMKLSSSAADGRPQGNCISVGPMLVNPVAS
jgi:hypothetical protein